MRRPSVRPSVAPPLRDPRCRVCAALLLGVMVVAGTITPAAAQSDGQALRLVRVMLSAGGVGYFEYEAAVTGDAVLELSVPLSQVDDVMKSIVVYDSTGAAGGIRLAGRNPVEQVFGDLPFDRDALASPVALLNALPGARVRAAGQRVVEGRLLRVVPETRRTEGGDTLTRHRVSVMTTEGLQSFLLEEAESVRFVDESLRAQIEQALSGVARHRAVERRRLSVSSRGGGARTVRVGYVVAAPLWKASYRLSLEDGDGARLQGWAILENMSGQDWSEVELTLVSGNPVTFRQALYEAYYAERPEVPVEVLGRVLPRVDGGEVAAMMESVDAESPLAMAAEADASPAVSGVRKRAMPAPGVAMGAAMAPQPAPPPASARLIAASAREAATSVRFRLPEPVSVESGQSLLVPIIDRDVPARRVALYQPGTHERHPLAAVTLRNDGGSGLPPGVLTLYESSPDGAAFVGDARLAPLPAGEQRMVSYALDQKVQIDREVEADQSIAGARLANGVLELTTSQVQRTRYRVKAPAAEARRLRIEHPRRPGWALESPGEDTVTLTETDYRIPLDLDAGASASLTVVQTRPTLRRLTLANFDTRQFAQYASTRELSQAQREAFQRLARQSAVVDRERRRVEAAEQAAQRIAAEQERIRGNLSRVPRDSDLHGRYLDKLGTQEDRLESLAEEAEEAREAMRAARSTLERLISGLTL